MRVVLLREESLPQRKVRGGIFWIELQGVLVLKDGPHRIAAFDKPVSPRDKPRGLFLFAAAAREIKQERNAKQNC